MATRVVFVQKTDMQTVWPTHFLRLLRMKIMVSFLQNERRFVSFTGTEEYFVLAESKAFLAFLA